MEADLEDSPSEAATESPPEETRQYSWIGAVIAESMQDFRKVNERLQEIEESRREFLQKR